MTSVRQRAAAAPKEQSAEAEENTTPTPTPAAAAAAAQAQAQGGQGQGQGQGQGEGGSLSRRALSQTLTGTANLAKLLPTGTLLAFQMLTPVFTNNGACDSVTRLLTLLLLLLLALSCFLACFTDTVKASDGRVYHGLATFTGLWLFDSDPSTSGLPDLTRYRLRLIDCVHALLSLLLFSAVALRDGDVLTCYYPDPRRETREVLDIVPLGIGLLCSFLFLLFPTTRHGIGYPVSPAR